MARRGTNLALAAIVLAVCAGGGAWAWQESRAACCTLPEEPHAPGDAHGGQHGGQHGDQHTDQAAHAPLDLPEPRADRPRLGLMTSLPLYWALGEDFATTASGRGTMPWQRQVLELGHELVPLDTLSPIPGLGPQDPETDPLAGIDRLAIVQPRGLSPADNVALDRWVRGGGHLLIVLDPLLTGHYDLALGDPRRPVDAALIPPVLARWGLTSSFDPDQPAAITYARLPGGNVPLEMGGTTGTSEEGSAAGCTTHPSKAITRCDRVGAGTVTYLLDAAVFEHPELVGEKGEAIQALVDYAFEQPAP